MDTSGSKYRGKLFVRRLTWVPNQKSLRTNHDKENGTGTRNTIHL